ncbi:hypothetical protein GCM10010470_38540 [Saccharopolyspora taberi]|uniref:Uncharacterized protein n=1 Tax=Saccharopolyspora taberi TaxID=60895 RepID=A0ABN3VGZ8_9PSEU
MAPPVAGTCSTPVTAGRQNNFIRGPSKMCFITQYSTAPLPPLEVASSESDHPRGSALALLAAPRPPIDKPTEPELHAQCGPAPDRPTAPRPVRR